MILELRHIDKTYLQGKLEVPVLRDVSLSVEEGDYLAVMGPSGSGKTTLMNIIGCLDVPTAGEYLLEGESLAGRSDAMLSQTRLNSIGFVFQSFYLLPRQSALENVALPLLYAGVGKKERLAKAKAALERVGLGDRLDFKPTQLSGGQCQRVAIARAMVNEPKLLLADEPTGALDTASGQQIMELFDRLNREGVTIVMITHEPSIAAQARRVLHIRDGRLVDAPLPVIPKAATAAATVPAAELDRLEPTAEEIAAFADENYEPAKAATAAPKAAAPSLAAPVFVRRQEPLPALIPVEIDLLPAARPVLEIEDIPIEAPERPEDFARSLRSMAETPIPFPKTEPLSPVVPAPAPVPVDDREATLEQDLADTLDAEISDLIHYGQETSGSFASGDMFLRDAAAAAPELVDRPTKSGAPDQIAFDIWKKPREIDVEAISSEITVEPELPEEPEPIEEPVTEEPIVEEAPAVEEELPTGEPAPAPQPTPEEDTVFDVVQAEIDASLGLAPPSRQIDLDLSRAFAKKGPALPWGPAAESEKDRLVEIPDLLQGGDDHG